MKEKDKIGFERRRAIALSKALKLLTQCQHKIEPMAHKILRVAWIK
jgi:hypothetical protein